MGAQVSFNIKIDGKPVESADVLGFTVERDMFQPDMAAIVLSNQESVYSAKYKIAAPIEVNVGDNDGKNIYKGEVVGFEATFKGGEKARLLVRGMNKMHRLLRKRKSVTFMDKKDQEIISQVANDAGLSLKWKHDVAIVYKHVYQHNLTDLEFIRMRAARLGAHVWCVDKDLYVQAPDLQSKPLATLKMGDTGTDAFRSFTPRLSSAAIVKQVTVKGWNPETKELLTGVASVEGSKLGKETSIAASFDFGKDETFTVDHPIWSNEEAKAIAKARLQDLSLSYITGECEVQGDARYDLGKVVQIVCNPEESKNDDPFNGNYYIMGVTHKYTVPRNKDGGYTSILRLARDAQKPKESIS
ncbi:MAG TPA: contractile injection system protein, VgrG/Pvc8 family [Kofleriaceae bacterium]|nr:contractile injection system protein, VgrG/Pvc8 family [Kofleriaceae bacterium]